jgi:hypothetical protein
MPLCLEGTRLRAARTPFGRRQIYSRQYPTCISVPSVASKGIPLSLQEHRILPSVLLEGAPRIATPLLTTLRIHSAPDNPETRPAIPGRHEPPKVTLINAVFRNCSCGYIVTFSRTSAPPLPGKTLFLAMVTVDTCCAWALCSLDEHGNVLFFHQLHDQCSYQLVIA